jgi:hypothetical protein
MKKKKITVVILLCAASIISFLLAGYCFYNYRHMVTTVEYYGMPESQMWQTTAFADILFDLVFAAISYACQGIALGVSAVIVMVVKFVGSEKNRY